LSNGRQRSIAIGVKCRNGSLWASIQKTTIETLLSSLRIVRDVNAVADSAIALRYNGYQWLVHIQRRTKGSPKDVSEKQPISYSKELPRHGEVLRYGWKAYNLSMTDIMIFL
jgi:hypothetical protein